jgi:hypothetical protein
MIVSEAITTPKVSAATIARWSYFRSLLATAALTALAILFFALTAREGIISTNDGSHFALTKALAVDGTASIDPYVNYAAIQPARGTPTVEDYRDLSFYDGHFYSDRPPGTALLAVPFYWLGNAADTVSGRVELDFPLRYVTMLPPLLGAATALALALLARGLGAGWPAAVATAAIGALTTLILKYATLLYSHITGAAFVTGALAVVLLAERSERYRRWLLALGGLLLGYSAVAEYPNLLLIAPVGAYVLWRWLRPGDRGPWTVDRGPQLPSTVYRLLSTVYRLPPTAFALGWLVPVILLLGYNWAVFGRPWHTSYTYQYYFTWSRSVSTTYILQPGYVVEGLRWLLVGSAGLFTITPVLLLAIWGLVLLARKAPARALLIVGVVLIILLPTAAHRTYKGGGSQDTRYLLAIVPTLLAPLAIWFEQVAWPSGRRVGGGATRLAWLILVAVLCGWGFLRSYLSLLAMFGHRAVERTPGEAFDILRANWRDPQVIAPGYFLLHYFVVLVVPLAVVCWLLVVASRWAKSRTSQEATEGKSPA